MMQCSDSSNLVDREAASAVREMQNLYVDIAVTNLIIFRLIVVEEEEGKQKPTDIKCSPAMG